MVEGAADAARMAADGAASAVADDERLRCEHVHAMLRAHATEQWEPRRTAVDNPIPKVVVQFWDDPAGVPADVRECITSWAPLADQGFRRVLFDDTTARRFVANGFGSAYVEAFDRCGHPAMRCDYFRLCYLVRHGGFYVDADEVYKGGDCEILFADARLKLQPLCWDATTGGMIPAATFTARIDQPPGWTYYVNNNPIVAPPGHPVLRAALDRASGLLLQGAAARFGIQSTTGPGNLTACLVTHDIRRGATGARPDFAFLIEWDALSESRWPLDYRQDERNWRLWDPSP